MTRPIMSIWHCIQAILAIPSIKLALIGILEILFFWWKDKLKDYLFGKPKQTTTIISNDTPYILGMSKPELCPTCATVIKKKKQVKKIIPTITKLKTTTTRRKPRARVKK